MYHHLIFGLTNTESANMTLSSISGYAVLTILFPIIVIIALVIVCILLTSVASRLGTISDQLSDLNDNVLHGPLTRDEYTSYKTKVTIERIADQKNLSKIVIACFVLILGGVSVFVGMSAPKIDAVAMTFIVAGALAIIASIFIPFIGNKSTKEASNNATTSNENIHTNQD